MTRKILLGLLALSCAALAGAAALPLRINFQGKLLDPSTNAPKSGSQTVKFNIYTAASGGALLWGPETQAVTATNGVFSAQLGSVLALSPDVFANGQTYLGVTVGSDAEMTPRQQLVMSPYAYASAELVQSSDIRVNAGTAYSTFTAAGNLLLPAGVVASTGAFTGGVTASSGTLTATGATQYSLQTASGAHVLGGTLQVDGSGGVAVQYGVVASTFSGDGADLLNARPSVSSVTANNAFTAPAATEILVSSAPIVANRANSLFQVWAVLGLNRANNSLTTWSLRVRRNIGSPCTTASTQVGITTNHTVPNTAGTSNLVPIIKVDNPGATAGQTVWYCVTVNASAAQTMDERTMIVMELQP